MANGIKIYENWCEAIHEKAIESPAKARDLAFRILDYGATGLMDLDGLSGVDKDWLVSVQRGIEKSQDRSENSPKSPGRPKILIDDEIRKLFSEGVTMGTEIARRLNVSKDTVYESTPWKEKQALKKKEKESAAPKKIDYNF